MISAAFFILFEGSEFCSGYSIRNETDIGTQKNIFAETQIK